MKQIKLIISRSSTFIYDAHHILNYIQIDFQITLLREKSQGYSENKNPKVSKFLQSPDCDYWDQPKNEKISIRDSRPRKNLTSKPTVLMSHES